MSCIDLVQLRGGASTVPLVLRQSNPRLRIHPFRDIVDVRSLPEPDQIQVLVLDTPAPDTAAVKKLAAYAPNALLLVTCPRPGEEMAMELILAGARDCVFYDRVQRLPHRLEQMLRAGEARHQTAKGAAAPASPMESQGAQRLHTLAGAASEWLWEMDSDHRFTYSSAQSWELLGHMPQALVGRTPLAFMPEEAAQRFQILVDSIAGAALPMPPAEVVLRHRDGQHVVLESHLSPILDESGRACGIRGVSRDVSPHLHYDRALQASEERFRQLAENIHECLFIYDNRENQLIYVSPAFERIWRQPRRTAYDEPDRLLAMVHRDDLQKVRRAWRQRTNNRQVDLEFRIMRADGAARWIHARSFPVGRAGSARWVGVVDDITQRRQAEQALRDSEAKYRLLVENASDAIILADPQGRLLEINRSGETLTRYTADRLQGCTIYNLHPSQEHGAIAERMRRLPEAGTMRYECFALRADGTTLPVDVSASMVEHGGESFVQFVIRDMTARVESETLRLAREKQHRETLIREVHHRIKNNLQGVAGLLRRQASHHPALSAILENAILQVQAITVVYGIHSQAADGTVDLGDMLHAICQSAENLTGSPIDFDNQCVHNVPLHSSEAAPIALILNELVFNAVKHRGNNMEPPRVALSAAQHAVHVQVINTCSNQCDSFGFAAGRSVGTGLKLVKSLLPPRGCTLTLGAAGERVEAHLILEPPAIMRGAVQPSRPMAGDEQERVSS